MDSLEREAPRFFPQIQAQKYHLQVTWERLNQAIEARREVGHVSGSVGTVERSTAPSRFPLVLFQNLAAARERRSFEQAVSTLQGWLQEKTTLLEGEFPGHSLSPAGLLQQHRCLQVKALPRAAHPSPTLQAKDLCASLSLSAEMTDNGRLPGLMAVHLGLPEPLLQDIRLPSGQGTWHRL